ncbi:MAG: helix-turn-helix domain-containing protein [Rhodospirillaceae bacterium]|nr:helix-turn-helix domain-containing protein [Rhodospirillaceae bacterium]
MARRKRNIGNELIDAAAWILDDVRGIARPGRSHVVMVPDVKRIRRKLKVSQSEFATRYGLNVRTVQQWEQGRAVPDQPARVLLTLIDHAPATVELSLKRALAQAGRR